MPRVIVVGAGISGLSVAQRLQHLAPACEVQVLERAAKPGGLIDSVSRDGFLIETAANGFLDTNPCTLDLARSLGLGDRLVAASETAARNRFLLLDGQLRRLPSSFLSFLRSNLLSWRAKVSVLCERFRARNPTTADESIEAFFARRVGTEVTQTFADAFVTGILAGEPALLSMPACFPRLVTFEREHGSLMAGMAAARREKRQREGNARPWWRLFGRSAQPTRGSRMWSFTGGMRTLIDALAANLRTPIRCSVAVRRIVRAGTAWSVESEDERWLADAVVLACPADTQAALLADVDADITRDIGGIVFNRVVVVALGYRREDMPHSLDGFGYLTRQRDRRDVLGAQWCSSIFAQRAPAGKVLIRVLCGGWNRADVVDWPDDRLVAAVRAELTVSLGVRTEPVFEHIVRWPRAIPQYHLGHLDRVARIEDRLSQHPGLYVAGNAYRGVAINDCVEQSGRVAERVAMGLRS